MSKEQEPFLFISHASADKTNPLFLHLLKNLRAQDADIPLGIDTPSALPIFSKEDFVWSLARHEPYEEEIQTAITTTSSCALLVLSKAYLEETSKEGKLPWTRWKEAVFAKARAGQPGSKYKVFVAWLDDLSSEPSLPAELAGINAPRIYSSQAAIDALVDDVKAHFAEMRAVAAAPSEALATYLSGMVAKYEKIPIFGFRHRNRFLHLEEVYAALRGNLAVAADERASAYEAFSDALLASGGSFDVEADIQALVSRDVLGQMRGLGVAPELDGGVGGTVGLRLTLAEVTRTLRRLVILGGPGSGKTTLSQWLALTFARARLTSQAGQVKAPARHVDPESDSSALVEIGASRTPALIRIQEYAEALAAAPGGRLALIDFIGRHNWLPDGASSADYKVDAAVLGEAFRQEIDAGRALVILDGLDEVNEPALRRRVLEEVEAFDQRFVRGERIFVRPDRESVSAATRYGNQLIVTSRIAGYNALPLPTTWRHVTIEEMSETSVTRYWTRLFTAISDESELAQAPNDVARLREQVFGAGPTGLGELARVPLLATIIAATFDANGRQRLPEHRVEIYDTVVRTLVEEWRETGIRVEQWTPVLAPIANRMHASAGESMLTDSELRAELGERLTEMRGLASAEARREAVAVFMERVNAKVGLLAARRPGVYAFLHRTFQEFIAAYHLVERPNLALDRVRSVWLSPRWREVTLLAIGRTGLAESGWSEEARAAFLEALAQDARAGLGQPSLVLAAGMAELPVTPPAKAYEMVAQDLMLRLDGGEGQTASPGDLADACAVLAGRAPQLMTDALLGMLASGEKRLVHAAAVQILREGWLAPPLVRGLEAAEANADHETLLALRACLVRATQEVKKLEPPKAPKRLSSEEETDLARMDVSRFRQYAQDISQAHAAYRNQRRRFAALQALAPVESYRRSSSITSLAGLSEVRARIDDDLGWQAVIGGLYGGVDDLDAMQDYRRYNELTQFLQYTDAVRDALLQERPELRWRYGPGDTIYDIAVALDSGVHDVKKSTSTPVFDPACAVGADPIPDALRTALQAGKSAIEFAKSAQGLPGARSAQDKALLAFAVILADHEGERSAFDLVRRLPAEARKRLGELAERAGHAVKDGVFRALHSGTVTNAIRQSTFDLDAKGLIARIAIDTGVRLHPDAPFKINAFDTGADAEGVLFDFATTFGDDAKYNVAVIFDTLGGKLATLVATAPEAAMGPWLEAMGWPVTGFGPLGVKDPSDISIPVEDLFDSAPVWRLSADFRNALYKVTMPRSASPELAAALGVRGFDRVFASQFASVHEDEPQTGLQQRVAKARAIADPYYRARALATLVSRLGLGELASEAFDAARRIDDPERRALTCERIASIANAPLDRAAMAAATRAVERVTDARTQWRLRMRFAQNADRSKARRLQRQALGRLQKVREPWASAEDRWTLQRLAGAAATRELPRRRGKTTASHIADGDRRAAIGMIEADQKQSQALLPIYIARAAFDVLDALERAEARRADGFEELWRDGGGDAAKKLAAIGAGEPRQRRLTVDRARRVVKLVRKARKDKADLGRIACALPTLETPDMWGLKAARIWLQSDEPLLKAEGGLRIAERNGVFEPEVVDALSLALQSASEPLAMRASAILSNGHFLLIRPPTRLSTSQMDPALIERAAAAVIAPWDVPNTSSDDAKHPLRQFLRDIVYDDPDHFKGMLNAARSSPVMVAAIRQLRFVSHDCGKLLMEAVDASPPELQRVLADSIVDACRYSEFPNLEDWVLNRAPDHVRALRACPNRVVGVARALEAGFEAGGDDPAAIAQAAMAHFERVELPTLATLLAEGKTVAAALKTRGDDFSVWKNRQSVWTPLSEAGDDDGQHEVQTALPRRYGAKPVAMALAHWLQAAAARGAPDREAGCALLFVTFASSYLARVSPDLFWGSLDTVTDRSRFVERLRALAFAPKPYGWIAVAATRLLATDAQIDRETISHLMRFANGPDPFNSTIVEHALRSVSGANEGCIEPLIEAIDVYQPRVGAIAARTLAIIARDPLTRPQQRTRVVEALVRALQSPRAKTPIWRFIAGEKNEPGLVEPAGTLGESLLQALSVIDRSV